MAKKIYRTLSLVLLVFTLLSIILVLRKPSLSTAPTSGEAAKSFDTKLNQIAGAHRQGAPRKIRITETELNSKLTESLGSLDSSGGQPTLRAATVRMEGDRIIGTFDVSFMGLDVYLTLGGNLGVTNGAVEFKPTDVQMGTLPVPAGLVESALREKLNSPEVRERLKIPNSIKDVRVENGELVFEVR
jgi:hypothetical protein